MKRLIATFTGLAVAAMIVAPSPAQAITAAELQAQIDALNILKPHWVSYTGKFRIMLAAVAKILPK